jgi:hypothetical protein
MRVRDIVVNGFREVGMLPDGQPLDGDKTNVGIDVLNKFLRFLNQEAAFSFRELIAEYTFTEPKREITVGEAGNTPAPDVILGCRPSDVHALYYSSTPTASPVRSRKVALRDILEDSLPVGAVAAPLEFCFQQTYPCATIRFNCDAQPGSAIRFVYSAQFSQVSINDTIDISGEFQTALEYGFAERIAIRYGRPQEVVNNLAALYTSSKKAIIDANKSRRPLRHAGYSSGEFNIYNLGGNVPGRWF